jgi:hypothetical protein
LKMPEDNEMNEGKGDVSDTIREGIITLIYY